MKISTTICDACGKPSNKGGGIMILHRKPDSPEEIGRIDDSLELCRECYTEEQKYFRKRIKMTMDDLPDDMREKVEASA